jgi:predicted dehydrogenase
VIATATALHAHSFQQLSSLGYLGTVLVEKPFAIPQDLTSELVFARVGVGFNLRFHPVLVRLSEVLLGQTVYTVEAYAGQDLSTWRPGRALESQYSTSKRQGGGVLRDLSHELDYLSWLFGTCDGIFARGGRLTTMTKDSDDAWGIVASYERAQIVTLQLNYLDTQKRRRIVVNSSAGTIEADLVASTLRVNDKTESFEIDANNSYQALHQAMLDDSNAAVTTVSEALATDNLIAMIERSAASNQWIELK